MNVKNFLIEELKDYQFKTKEKYMYSKHNYKGQDIVHVIDELMDSLFDEGEEVSPIQDYQIDDVSVECGPGYDTGFVFIAWLDRKDSLNTFTIQWEIC